MTSINAASSSVQQLTDAREGNTCPECHHTFQSPFKLQKHLTEIKKQCKVVMKDLTCEHCEQPFATQKDLKRHHQRKQKACILIQELKAAHQEDKDKLQLELAAKQQQLDRLNANARDQPQGVAAVKAAQTSSPTPFEELLLQKLTDMQQNLSEIKVAICSGGAMQSSIASDRLMIIPVGNIVDDNESAIDVQYPDGCKHGIATDFVRAMDQNTANAVLDDGPKDTNHLHGLDVVDGHTVEGPSDGTLTSVAGGDELSVLNSLGGYNFMYSPSKEAVTHKAMHDSQNLSDKSIRSTDEAVRTTARQGERNGISNTDSNIASAAEQPSIASCNVVDKIATEILDTHAESSSEVAHDDFTHASPSTHGDEVPELEGRFEHASTVRVLAADSQSKSPSMQSCARARTNKYGQENLEYWHDMECRQLMKVLKIKSCKKKAWEPDHSVLVNMLKLIFCNASHPENWNILCPAIDSSIMWMFDGQKFHKKPTEATIYDLVGDVATYMFCVEDKLKEGMLLDVLNRIEGLTAYLKTVEDVSYCQSCEHCDFDFQELSLQFRAALHEHFKHIKGVQFLQADVQQ